MARSDRKHDRQRYHEVYRKAFGDLPVEGSAIELYGCVHRVYNGLNTANDDFLRPYNLTSAKFRLLWWLLACYKTGYDDGLLPSELSRFQGVSPNTTSSLLSALEEQGLIQRIRHATDHRKQIISISDTGRALLHDISTAYMDFIQATMSGLSQEERQILITLLHKMIHSVQHAVEDAEQNKISDP